MSFPFSLTPAVLFAIFWLPSVAQSRIELLQSALPSMLDSTATPGLSIALIENGKVAWSKGFGVKNKDTKEVVSASTIFRGASLGKPLFAYAVLQLSSQGKIALDSPLVEYVPKTYLENQFLMGPQADERISLITARMVLNHTSGLPNWRAEGKPLTTLFLPGSRYSYSGEGYYLLQKVVEYLVKQPIELFMKQMVFDPLGMKNTSYAYQATDTIRYARSYDMTGKPVVDEPEAPNVAHTLRTTAEDYARFIVETMMEPDLGKRMTMSLVSSPVKTDICQPGQVSWGTGFAIQHTATGDLFCQWAKSPAASGYVIGSSSQRIAVVYFVNIANQGLRIAERIVKLGLGYDDPLFRCFGVRPYNAGQ
ncbi:serine hydrolase domain-containing protein [Dyadobacter arcticus]|uniref:CubicO group peptidase (Beta-lactamase class C family) n=1 Tax=Dyadobacter arcticus TaxID=1078754 RepID=A0ABX0UKQ9_9BACT|nr:serine hydrolase domain-containing protein [Dyadobacter arcticus]NIJ52664.1 CubicO group peptidase (beta-lactamase class C family) [Dyadobacter arcticus]